MSSLFGNWNQCQWQHDVYVHTLWRFMVPGLAVFCYWYIASMLVCYKIAKFEFKVTVHYGLLGENVQQSTLIKVINPNLVINCKPGFYFIYIYLFYYICRWGSYWYLPSTLPSWATDYRQGRCRQQLCTWSLHNWKGTDRSGLRQDQKIGKSV